MDVWEILRSHSMLGPGYDAYENLLAQGEVGIVVINDVEIFLQCSDVEAEIEVVEYDVSIVEDEYTVLVEEEPYTIEVCDV